MLLIVFSGLGVLALLLGIYFALATSDCGFWNFFSFYCALVIASESRNQP